MAGASISGRVWPRRLGCAAARVPSRALRVPRHLPGSRPPLLVGRDADGGQYSGKTDCLGVSSVMTHTPSLASLICRNLRVLRAYIC
jgi:hypothetical protein